MLWLAAQSKLLKKDKFIHLNIDRMCVFCGTNLETWQYMFFSMCFDFKYLGIDQRLVGNEEVNDNNT